MIRVWIVSPNHALRAGLRQMLAEHPQIHVAGDSLDSRNIDEKDAEVLLLTSASALPATATLGLVLLTDSPAEAESLLRVNVHAWGVLPLNATGEELAAAIAAVAEGLWAGAPGLVRGMMRLSGAGESSGEDSLIETLTAREREVLQLIANGLANKQIAVQLSISEHTVKFHLSSLYAKLGAASRTEAVKRGLMLGLISL